MKEEKSMEAAKNLTKKHDTINEVGQDIKRASQNILKRRKKLFEKLSKN